MTKKSDNIAEYILSMWQMEDLVRAYQDDATLEQNQFLMEIKNMMLSEGIMPSGHTQLTMIAIEEMQDVHTELYDKDAQYRAAWIQLRPALTVLKSKTDDPTMSDIEMCLTFLYEIMLLRLQKREISAETLAIQHQVSSVLRFIALAYHANLTEEDM